MGGFKNEANNVIIERGIFERIISHLHDCCIEMKNACQRDGNCLSDHEDKITNRLYQYHLRYSQICGLRFILQSPQAYDPENDSFYGRADIQVESVDLFKNVDDYYLIECKRIDGTVALNKAYVSEGVARFVVHPPKYPSYHKRNIMLGYVVRSIDVEANSKNIADIQIKTLKEMAVDAFDLVSKAAEEFYRYFCAYQSEDVGKIDLTHLFYDFSSVVERTK